MKNGNKNNLIVKNNIIEFLIRFLWIVQIYFKIYIDFYLIIKVKYYQFIILLHHI